MHGAVTCLPRARRDGGQAVGGGEAEVIVAVRRPDGLVAKGRKSKWGGSGKVAVRDERVAVATILAAHLVGVLRYDCRYYYSIVDITARLTLCAN